MFAFKTVVLAVAAMAATASAEQHRITFTNRCGSGTPTIVQGNNVWTGDQTFDGPFSSWIAYLQTWDHRCGYNGENCVVVEGTLQDPNNGPGSGSSVDVSLIAPHAFTNNIGFGFYGGDNTCNGLGNDCPDANCGPQHAFYKPDDYACQVGCQARDVNLAIT
ncbi:hypothetical protein HKX48_006344 [Thoreauomyces humboldtii]|nr:hypothetical protein HKX48_006344 [Thoreauomyces humboldtii]